MKRRMPGTAESFWLSAAPIIGGMLVVFAMSWCVTRLVTHYALRRTLLDIPNVRSSHTQPTPRGGGLSMVLLWFVIVAGSWASGFVTTRLAAALACGLVIAAVGWWDDVKSLPAGGRFVAQLAIAALAIALLVD